MLELGRPRATLGQAFQAQKPSADGDQSVRSRNCSTIQSMTTRRRGESWRVRSSRPLRRGQRLRVTAMEGLLLTVVPDSDKGD